jgi:hypothetical protein
VKFRFKKEDALDRFDDNDTIIQLKIRSITLRDMEATCFREYLLKRCIVKVIMSLPLLYFY